MLCIDIDSGPYEPFLKQFLIIHVPGTVSHYLLENKKGSGHSTLLCDVAKTLRDYHLKCSSPETESLKTCCALYGNVSKLMGKNMTSIWDSEKHSWVSSLKNAFARFTELLESRGQGWIEEEVKSAGPAAANSVLRQITLAPPKLTQTSCVLVQASFLDALELPKDDDKPVPALTKMIKDYVSLKSLNMEMLKGIFPSHVEKVEGFLHAVSDIMTGKMIRLQKESNDATNTLKPFRTGFGCDKLGFGWAFGLEQCVSTSSFIWGFI